MEGHESLAATRSQIRTLQIINVLVKGILQPGGYLVGGLGMDYVYRVMSS